MNKTNHPIIKGTIILTATGLITRLIGFAYRIFLSRLIGAEGMGIYQLIGPVSGICFALCCGPIQTSVSRFVAGASASESRGSSRSYFYGGLMLSEFMAFLSAATVYFYAAQIAERLLGEPRCTILLQLLALSLPITAAHASINGYYYGKKKTEVPALSQLAEQIIRVLSVYAMAFYAEKRGISLSVTIAALGLLTGEIASLMVSLIAIQLTFFKDNKKQRHSSIADKKLLCSSDITLPRIIKRISIMASPLTANRLILGFLQSVEAIQIPAQLMLSGLTNSEALSVYGVLTGMALPFIFFPSALTNSVSVMLLPSVAEAQSANNEARIGRTTEISIGFSLYMGILCAGIFAAFGGDMGIIFFQDANAGAYIRILGWLCPFLYLAATVGSILNGMGCTGTTFTQNLIGLVCRLSFVFLLIPEYGITAYLWGMMVCELVVAGLHIFSLRKRVSFAFSPFHRILRPMAAAAFGVWFSSQLPFSRNIIGLFCNCALVAGIYLVLLYFTGSYRFARKSGHD